MSKFITSKVEEEIKDGVHRLTIETKIRPFVKSHVDDLPKTSRDRFERHGVDLSNGYPEISPIAPFYLDEAVAVRSHDRDFFDPGTLADPEKKALFGAAKEVKHLTKHIGTEIVGLQLADLTNEQRNELALLIAERSVVFFRDQDLSPQAQVDLGQYFGTLEIHPRVPHVPGVPGAHTLWPDFFDAENKKNSNFRNPGGAASWHTDVVYEHHPAGITHLHNDAIPSNGGDTTWASGYGAYDKLSPAFQKFLDGKTAIYISADKYVDRDDPLAAPRPVEREFPLVRTHPVTGWKSLWVNRQFTKSIVGLDPKESDLVLNYLYSVYESNLDIQVRFKWQPTKEGLGTSALWDNRITQHIAVYDYEGKEPRHGTRVISLAEKPYFDPNSKSRREALGLDD